MCLASCVCSSDDAWPPVAVSLTLVAGAELGGGALSPLMTTTSVSLSFVLDDDDDAAAACGSDVVETDVDDVDATSTLFVSFMYLTRYSSIKCIL